MPDDIKTVTPVAGSTLYTGLGLHPFRPGEIAELPASHADDLAGQGAVEHVAAQPTPAAADPQREKQAALLRPTKAGA